MCHWTSTSICFVPWKSPQMWPFPRFFCWLAKDPTLIQPSTNDFPTRSWHGRISLQCSNESFLFSGAESKITGASLTPLATRKEFWVVGSARNPVMGRRDPWMAEMLGFCKFSYSYSKGRRFFLNVFFKPKVQVSNQRQIEIWYIHVWYIRSKLKLKRIPNTQWSM